MPLGVAAADGETAGAGPAGGVLVVPSVDRSDASGNALAPEQHVRKRNPLAFPLLLGGAALLGAELGVRAFRHSQLFLPSREPVRTWDPADYGLPADAVEEHWIATANGERLHAWYCRAANPVASALFCHGNTGNLTISADIVPHLLTAGLSVLLFDYRGFGKSSGKPTYKGVIADGVTAARFHDSLQPAHLPSILYGFSLGGAVAAQVMHRHPFDALILQSTFTSLTGLTRLLYPRIPLHFFARKLFDTLRVVRALDVPLLVLHGAEDEVIPCWMAHEIYGACKAPKRIHCVEGGMHKDIFLRDPDSLIWNLAQFLAEVRPRSLVQRVESAREQRGGTRVIASAAR